jgi:glutamate carboxypeptidase
LHFALFPYYFYKIMTQHQEITSLITSLAEINSGSFNVAGCHHVQQELIKLIRPLTDNITLYPTAPVMHLADDGRKISQQFSSVLHAKINPQALYRVCLFGHVDTVFPENHPFQSVSRSGNFLSGPGVSDMKGGIIIMLEALKRFLTSTDTLNIGFDIVLNGDEEIGSLASSDYLLSLCPSLSVALGYEPALPCGSFAQHRKGGITFSILAKGLSAHAGRDFDKGRNAITALSRLSVFCDDLWRQNTGLSINVGQFTGGGAVNVVPDTAIMRMNMRSFDNGQLKNIYKTIQEYALELSSTYEVSFEFIERNRRKPKTSFDKQVILEESLKNIHKEMSLSCTFKHTGGMCDGNLFAGENIPTIDTLGAIGDHIHTDNEYLDIEAVETRIQLSQRVFEMLNNPSYK